MIRPIVLTALLLPAAAQAAVVNFCWLGANGYTMTGRMEVPDNAMYQAVITEADVTRFKISGYYKRQLIGTWNAAQAKRDTTWHLRFDPMGMTFLTGGVFATTHSQGWNADGDVENCGNPGFGFNSGSYGQDICVNGTYFTASSIAPDTPLVATTQTVTSDCRKTVPTSKMPIRESGY